MSDDRRRSRRAGDPPREFSELIGAELVIGVGIWVLVALFCFFVVGPIAGIAAILVGVIACGLIFAAAVRRAEIRD